MPFIRKKRTRPSAPAFPPPEPTLELTTITTNPPHLAELPAPATFSEKTQEKTTGHTTGNTTDQSFHLEKDQKEQDPETIVATLQSNWSRNPEPPLPFAYSSTPPEEPWASSAALAWYAARRDNNPLFEKYCLSRFILASAFTPVQSLHFIESNCHPTSPIRRFANYWIAWNHRLAGHRSQKFASLAAARLAPAIQNRSEDPRPYDINHWYERCGDDLAPTCDHVPSVRANKAENEKREAQKAARTVDARGRSFEAARQRPPPAVTTAPAPVPSTFVPYRPRRKGCTCLRAFITAVYIIHIIILGGTGGAIVSGSFDYPRQSTTSTRYNIFVVLVQILFFIGVFILPRRTLQGWYVLCLFLVPDVIALSVDTSRCFKSVDGGVACAYPTAVTLFTGTSLFASLGHALAWRVK